MSVISGQKISLTTDTQITRADELMDLVKDIIKKIEEIDTSIESLVKGGIEGKTVDAMTATYDNNRQVINEYVKKFSAAASLLRENAEVTKKKTQEAIEAAGGK